MKTFFNILQTLINIKNKKYPDEPFVTENINDFLTIGKNSHIFYLINTIHFKLKQSEISNILYKNSFIKLKCFDDILQNNFYNNELKEYIFNIFSKAQKHYFAFVKLRHLFRIKKNSYVVENDLNMTPLDHKHKLTFILVENKSNYLFNINELVKIIETAIGNSPNFFCEPLYPLNPYTNQPFTLSTLYNIYFHLKKINRVTPQLFHYFFLENFDKTKFVDQYEPLIRELAIKNYVNNSPYNVLHPKVLQMIKKNHYTKNLIIHEDFPKDFLVDIFRPFLIYDFICKYYIKNTYKYYNSKQILNNKLKKFYQFNKAFGRRYIKVTRFNKKIIKREIIFDCKHISFYKIPDCSLSNDNTISLLSTINILINNDIHFNALDNNNSDSNNSDNNNSDESEETNSTNENLDWTDNENGNYTTNTSEVQYNSELDQYLDENESTS
jgi:hypothetical protein